MVEAWNHLHQAENRIVGGFNDLNGSVGEIAALHAGAYELAGSTPEDAAEHARAVRAHADAIRASIEEIRSRFRMLREATKAASATAQDGEARRKAERAKLGL